MPRHAPIAIVLLVVVLTVWLPTPARGLTADVTIEPSEPSPFGTTLTFDGRGSTDAVSWVWDFGDGAQAEGAVVEHVYRHGGSHVVTLMTKDGRGGRSQRWTKVQVTPFFEGKVVEDLVIETRAGVLRGSVTRPDAPGRFPVILEYGPYGTGGVGDDNWHRTLIESGYAYAKVAMPGRWNSDGDFDMFGDRTAAAGCDVVGWLADQPWAQRRVGMVGFSGPAVAALTTVSRCSDPALATVAVHGAFADFYRDEVHVGGTTNSNTFVNAWNALFYAEPATAQSADAVRTAPTDGVAITQVAADMYAHPFRDAWWEERTVVDRPLDVPILYVGTHRDLWPRAAPELFRWIAPAGGRAILMYGGHGPQDPTGFSPALQTGDGGLGEAAVGEMRAWLDHHLRRVDNGVDARAPLSLLVPRGADWGASLGHDWLGLEQWPDPATQWQTLALSAGGVLGEATDGSTQALGGAAHGAVSAEVDGVQQVTFTSEPLVSDLTVAGPASLRLFAALEGTDAAWNVLLEEVLADGTVRPVQDGALQASHRALSDATRRTPDGVVFQPVHPHTDETTAPVLPGDVHEYDVELPTTFNTFLAGSRIRLRIATNDLRPVLDGHGTIPTTVAFTIVRSQDAPSALLLPVLDPVERRLPHPYGLPEQLAPIGVPAVTAVPPARATVPVSTGPLPATGSGATTVAMALLLGGLVVTGSHRRRSATT